MVYDIEQSRTSYLCLLTTALGGTWFLEQPGGSMYEYFIPFRELLLALYQNHGSSAATQTLLALFPNHYTSVLFVSKCLVLTQPSEVSKTSWWMRHYGGPSPKRHWAYCNSEVVQQLNCGKLTKHDKKGCTARNAEVYHNRAGKKCFKGTSTLKSSEFLR